MDLLARFATWTMCFIRVADVRLGGNRISGSTRDVSGRSTSFEFDTSITWSEPQGVTVLVHSHRNSWEMVIDLGGTVTRTFRHLICHTYRVIDVGGEAAMVHKPCTGFEECAVKVTRDMLLELWPCDSPDMSYSMLYFRLPHGHNTAPKHKGL